MEIGQTFYGRTYRRTDTPVFRSTRSSVGDDLKMGDDGGWLLISPDRVAPVRMVGGHSMGPGLQLF